VKRRLWSLCKRIFRRCYLEDVDAVLLAAFERRLIGSRALHEMDAGFKYGRDLRIVASSVLRETVRICAIVGCEEPDVIAPHDGTWPTCSGKMPICRDHLLTVSQNQRFPIPDRARAAVAHNETLGPGRLVPEEWEGDNL
jgi:hypothetical protein